MTLIDRKRSPFARYREYVTQLEQAGRKFPVNQFGDINFSKIAEECGNRRQWFSENAKKVFCQQGDTLQEIIAKDIRHIGSELVGFKDADAALAEAADTKSREASKLRTLLEEKSNENELLRDQVERLSAEVRTLRAKAAEIASQQELMIDSGRTFIL